MTDAAVRLTQANEWVQSAAKERRNSERSGIRTRQACGFFVPGFYAGRVTDKTPRKGEEVRRLRSVSNLPASRWARVETSPLGFSISRRRYNMPRSSSARKGDDLLRATIRTAASNLPDDAVSRIVDAVLPSLHQPPSNSDFITAENLQFFSSTRGLISMVRTATDTNDLILERFQYLLCSIQHAVHEDRDSKWVESLCDIAGEWIMRQQEAAKEFRPLLETALATARHATEAGGAA